MSNWAKHRVVSLFFNFFHARGSCSLIIRLNQPKRHQLAKIDLHQCHEWQRMARTFHVSLVIVGFSWVPGVQTYPDNGSARPLGPAWL